MSSGQMDNLSLFLFIEMLMVGVGEPKILLNHANTSMFWLTVVNKS